MTRRHLRSAAFLAKLGITVQFLALIRCLAEYFRLKHVAGPAFDPASAEPFILGGLVVALFCWISVLLYFAGRLRLVVLTTGLSLGALIILKFALLGR